MAGLTYEKTVTVSAASTNGVAASQTPLAAGNLTLSASTVTLPNAGQRPQIISAADLSAITFTFYGTDQRGRPMTYAMAGPDTTPNEAIAGVSFATLTRVAVSGATGAALTVGWAAQADMPDLAMDYRMAPTDIQFGCVVVSGSPTYTATFTLDDIYASDYNRGTAKWWDHPTVAGETTDQYGSYDKVITAQSMHVSGEGSVRFRTWQGTSIT